MRTRILNKKIFWLIMIVLTTLSFTGVSSGHWMKIITIDGTITTATWYDYQDIEKVYLYKIIDGVYWGMDPYPEEPPTDLPKVSEDLPLIYINSQQNIRQWFKVVLMVTNEGNLDFENIQVSDVVHKKMAVEFVVDDGTGNYQKPELGTTWFIENGQIEFIGLGNGDLRINWTISELAAGQADSITLWIGTTQQGGGKWHPTSEDGDDLPINTGASLTVWYDVEGQTVPYDAEIPGITFWTKDYGEKDDQIAQLVLEDLSEFTFPYTMYTHPEVPDNLGMTILATD